MFVGEAPGFHEDKQGVPFVGQAGKLLEKLLAGIGLRREDVYIANVLKCRPPGNRDPQPDEIEACEGHLWKQIELIQPKVVATLGNFATKLLSGRPLGITRVHGQEQEATLGGNRVLLYPLYHPAAALYTPRMLEVLESDFRRLPELLGRAIEPVPAPEPAFQPPARAGRPARPVLARAGFYPSPRGGGGDELAGGDGGRCRAARGRAALRGRRHRLGRARLGQDDVRPRRVPLRSASTAPVTSPTFTIGHRYDGRVAVSHLDLYRFTTVSHAEWGDLEPYFDDAVAFVEWPEAGAGVLPAPRFRVRMRHSGPELRTITIERADTRV